MWRYNLLAVLPYTPDLAQFDLTISLFIDTPARVIRKANFTSRGKTSRVRLQKVRYKLFKSSKSSKILPSTPPWKIMIIPLKNHICTQKFPISRSIRSSLYTHTHPLSQLFHQHLTNTITRHSPLVPYIYSFDPRMMITQTYCLAHISLHGSCRRVPRERKQPLYWHTFHNRERGCGVPRAAADAADLGFCFLRLDLG